MIGAYIGKKGGVHPYVRNSVCNCFFSSYEMEGYVMICRVDAGMSSYNGIYIIKTCNPEETINEMTEAYGCHVEVLRKTEMSTDYHKVYTNMVSRLRDHLTVRYVESPRRTLIYNKVSEIKYSDRTPLEKIDAILEDRPCGTAFSEMIRVEL